MSNEQSSFPVYLLPEQLCIGVFVELELAWFKHDFARSSFKISTETQLSEVLALRLPRYRYDPERSDILFSELADSKPIETLPQQAEQPISSDEPALLEEHQQENSLAQREQKIQEIEKAFSKASSLMKNLSRDLLSKPLEAREEMEALVSEMVTAFLESTEVTLHVMGERTGGEEVYYHTLNVTILAMMLAKELGLSCEMAHELGVGAIVHDIGLTKIPDRISKKDAGEYTSAERNLRAMHVEYGVEIGRLAGLSADALSVIEQHHEFADGSGYPNALKEADMTPAARIVSLVNYYDNLCNPIDISKAMSPHDALSLMFAQRRGKFESRALALMIRSLGVYPPGTIVQLSDESIGAVISVNPKRSLRPCVLIYDPKVHKDKAIILNLEDEPSISISKTITPSSLPHKALIYLCPRRRVTYFFGSSNMEDKA
ncbi:MAG: DUF3391 domain-containing protein [Gallionellaceae bacterium]